MSQYEHIIIGATVELDSTELGGTTKGSELIEKANLGLRRAVIDDLRLAEQNTAFDEQKTYIHSLLEDLDV